MDTDKHSGEKPSILIEGDLTEKILGAAFKVQTSLGSGFLEKVYENALLVELSRMGLQAEQQKQLKVTYEGAIVGDFFADLIIEGRVLLECKAVSNLETSHEAQMLNYLKATGIKVGMALNFGRTRLQYKRLVC